MKSIESSLKRLKKLEKKFGVKEKPLMFITWDPHANSVWGTIKHISGVPFDPNALSMPLKEELQYLQARWQEGGYKIPGKNDKCSFADYLEYRSGPDKYSESRKKIIKKIREEGFNNNFSFKIDDELIKDNKMFPWDPSRFRTKV